MDFTERRRPAVTRAFVWRALLAWLAIVVVFVGTRWQQIANLEFSDIDDQLRLVQVRDLANGQGWFDLTQHRIDPPGGTLMHWSRIVDLPLVLTLRLLTPLLGSALAEQVMLVAVPMLLLGVALFLVGRLAWRLFDLELGVLACVLLALSPPFATQFQPLRIDHHGWQIIAVLLAFNGLAARRAMLGAWIAGAALALGLSISLELLPIAALLGGVLALRWFEERGDRTTLFHFSASLAVISALSFVLTRGLADLAGHCDAVSPPYVAGLAVLAGGIALLGKVAPVRWPLLLAGFAIVGLAAVGAVVGLAPDCARGPFEALDPLVRQFWYLNVYEGRPVWLQLPGAMLQMTVPPAVGLYAAMRLWRRQSQSIWLRGFWRDYTLVLAGLLVMGLLIARSSAFAVTVGMVPLAWLVREWALRLVAARKPLLKLKYLFAMLLALIPGAFAVLPGTLFPALASTKVSAAPLRACNIRQAARELDRLPAATFLTPLDLGPSLLLHSRHAVVATGHHRAARAMHDTIATYLAEPAKARAIVQARGVRYVLLCPALAETLNYRAAAPQGLAARLIQGEVPQWLRPVPLGRQSGVLVWEVIAAP